MITPSDEAVVLVTGATGAVGPAIIRACRKAGYRVRVLARDPVRLAQLPDEVERFAADITDRKSVRQAVEGATTVIHLASLLHVLGPNSDDEVEYRRVNVGGTAAVVDACIDAGVRTVLMASTINVYGACSDTVWNETSIPEPVDSYSKSKLEAEDLVLSASSLDGELVGCVLRLGAVFGPEIKGNYLSLVRGLARGRFIPIGRGRNYRAIIHEDDAAAAFILALRSPESIGGIFNVTDGKTHTVESIIRSICEGLGRSAPKVFLPVRLVDAGLRFATAIPGTLGTRASVLRCRLVKYQESVEVSTERIRKVLKFTPNVSLRSGWRQTVESLRDRGKI